MSLRKSKLFQICLCILLFTAMLLSFWIPIAKADYEEPPNDLGVMEITGIMNSKGQMVVTPETPENVFDLDGAIYPGGTWKRTIRVTNDAPTQMYFALVSVTPKDEATMLFDDLELQLAVNEKSIYTGPYGAGSDKDPISKTYTISPGESLDLVASVSLSTSVKNGLQGNPLDSFWNFNVSFADYKTDDGKDDNDEESKYYVYYEDESGVTLHEPKVGKADVGDTVTERAIEIKGYTPDEEVKSIKISGSSNRNMLRFVYSPDKAEDIEDPEDPTTPVDPKDPPKTPQTGYELTDNRTTMLVLCTCMALFLTAALLVVRKILAASNKKISDSKTEEEEHHDE